MASAPTGTIETIEPAVIDTIKFCRSTVGLDATAATVIELGRQIWRDHKVSSELFARAKSLFGANKLIDLVLLMGNYAGTAALLTALSPNGSRPWSIARR